MAILEVKHINKSFGRTEVLKDVNFSLEEGQVLSIIGSSGSGKTTLLRCLNFLERPNNGVIRVKDEVLFDWTDKTTQSDEQIRKKRLHFGLVFQSFNLFPQYTALQNVMLAKELLAKEQPGYKERKKEVHEEIRQKAIELLTKMGLENRIVYNLVDVIEGNCRIKQALIRDRRYPSLYLLPSAQTKDKSAVKPEQMIKMIDHLRSQFDFIILDCPAGIEQGFKNAIAGADRAIVVTTAEISAIRDADRIIGLLEAAEKTSEFAEGEKGFRPLRNPVRLRDGGQEPYISEGAVPISCERAASRCSGTYLR